MVQIFLDFIRRSGESSGSAALGEAPASTWSLLRGHCPLLGLAIEAGLDAGGSLCGRRALLLVAALLDHSARNIGQVFFCNNPLSGALILAGLAVDAPRAAVLALIASTLGLVTALALGVSRSTLAAGLSGFNAVLVGTVLPLVLPRMLSEEDLPASATLLALAAAISVLLSSSLNNSLGSLRPALPATSLPFNVLAVLLALLLQLRATPLSEPHQHTTHAANATLGPPPWQIVKLLEGVALSAGQVLAVEGRWCSGLVLLAMLVCSPILLGAALLGALIGTFGGVLLVPSLATPAHQGLLGYNSLLAASAVAFLYVPTWRSALIAVLAALLALALHVAGLAALTASGVPVFTVPFVASVLLVCGTSSSRLPRPGQLTYPEQHRAQWLRERRERREQPLQLEGVESRPSSALRTASTSLPSGPANPEASWRTLEMREVPAPPGVMLKVGRRESLCPSPLPPRRSAASSGSGSTSTLHADTPSLAFSLAPSVSSSVTSSSRTRGTKSPSVTTQVTVHEPTESVHTLAAAGASCIAEEQGE